jgi:hypothetical protein
MGRNKRVKSKRSKPKATAVPTPGLLEPEPVILPRVFEVVPVPKELWRRTARSRTIYDVDSFRRQFGRPPTDEEVEKLGIHLKPLPPEPDPATLPDPADPFAFIEAQAVADTVELDVKKGSFEDLVYRLAARRQKRGQWTVADAAFMARVIDAPGKPGAQKSRDVSDSAHRIAWFERYMPELLRGSRLGRERLAKAIDETWTTKQLNQFRKQHRDKIESAKELLPDELSPLVKKPTL